HPRSDAREGPVPRLLLPGRAAGSPVEHLLEPPRVVDDLDGRRALAAQRALADGMAGVTLDVDDGARLRGNDLAAADTAEGTDRRGRSRAEGLEWRNRGAAAGLGQCPGRYRAGGQPAQKLPARRPRRIVLRLVLVAHGARIASAKSAGLAMRLRSKARWTHFGDCLSV